MSTMKNKLIKIFAGLGVIAVLGFVAILFLYWGQPNREEGIVSGAEVKGSVEEYMVDEEVNNYRLKIGLPSLKKDNRLCDIADERSKELHKLQNLDYHEGLKDKKYEREYLYVENGVGPLNNETEALPTWLGSEFHRNAIEGDWTYACMKCEGQWCIQIFSSFDTKDHSANKPAPVLIRDNSPACNSKYFCDEMTSCSEAIEFYRDCGLTRLDNDGDGIPCEDLCL